MSAHRSAKNPHRLIALLIAALVTLVVTGLVSSSLGDMLIGIAGGALALPLALLTLRPMLESTPRPRGI
jgi:hypothetical protein